MNRRDMKIGVPEDEGQLTLVFNKGGARKGAGRRGIGETRKVSITLPQDVWSEIDQIATESSYSSKSELLRLLIVTGLHEHRKEVL